MGSAGEVGFGLATAVGYGSADYLAKTTADRVGFFGSLWYLEVFGTPLVVALAILFEGLPPLPLRPLLLLVGLSLVGFAGGYFLYRSFEFGTLAVVSPLASGYPALIVVLAVVLLHEALTVPDLAGIVLTIVGLVLISRVQTDRPSPAKSDRIGIASALVAFACFAVFYFGLKLVVGPIPPIMSAAVTRLTALPPVLVLALVRKFPKVPPAGLRVRAVGIAVLDSLALVAYNVGITVSPSLAVLGTVSGLFSAVTVLWAVVFLHERLGRAQWLGAAMIFAGIAVLSLGGG